MANVKFSDFAVRTTVPTVDYIVGYQGAANIQIAPTDFLGDYLPLAGGTMIGDVVYNDSVKAKFGTGADSELYHTGSHLFFDNAIGTSYIRNTAAGGTGILLRNSVIGDIQFDNEFAGNILFNTSNVERMRIDLDGNVGIAVDNPEARLQVNEIPQAGGSTTTAPSLAHFVGSTAPSTVNGFATLKLEYPAGATPGDAGAQIMFTQGYHSGDPDNTQPVGSLRGYRSGADTQYGGGLQLTYQPNGLPLGLLPGITLDGAGNVGIGTDDPTSIVHIANATNPVLRVEDTTNNATVAMYCTNNETWMGALSNHELAILTNDIAAITIDTSQTVTIGNGTVAAANAAADDFVITGPGTTATGMTISNTSDSGVGTIFFGDTTSSSAAGFRYDHNTGDMSVSAEDDINFTCDNVGISGTPASKLDVHAAAGDGIRVSNTTSAAYNSDLIVNFNDVSTMQLRCLGTSILQAGNTGNTVLSTRTDKDIDIDPNGTGVINLKGNVRTGTSTETANTNFDNIVIEDVTGHSGMTIFSKSDSDGAIYFGDEGANNLGQIKYLHASNSMTFSTNDTERMRITNTGLTKINSSTSGNHEAFQKTGTYNKTSTGSTTAMTIVKVGHSHAVNYTVTAKIDTSNVGVLVGNTATAYGSNGGIVVDSEAYSGVISDIAVTYDNSYYGLNVAVTYTGASHPIIYMAVTGQSSEDFVAQ